MYNFMVLGFITKSPLITFPPQQLYLQYQIFICILSFITFNGFHQRQLIMLTTIGLHSARRGLMNMGLKTVTLSDTLNGMFDNMKKDGITA